MVLRYQTNEWYPGGVQISLHIRSPAFQAWGRGYSGVNFGDLKSEVFHFGGGGVGVKTENTQSAKKWLNFNFGGGVGGWGGGGSWGGKSAKTENTQSAKKWLNFNGGVRFQN